MHLSPVPQFLLIRDILEVMLTGKTLQDMDSLRWVPRFNKMFCISVKKIQGLLSHTRGCVPESAVETENRIKREFRLSEVENCV